MSEVIKDVSDTAYWVAHYRAQETERTDALFKDPFARILVGDFATKIDTIDPTLTKFTRWSVVMRTVIIDKMIRDLISQGVTTFLNLGSGLDSRAYRMNFRNDIQWIEMDFPHVMTYKSNLLKSFKPTCKLLSISLNLADRESRKTKLKELATTFSRIAVITEGVLPYLTEDQISEISDDLIEGASFKFWIGEYLSPKTYRHLKNSKRMALLKNAPFRFYPEDWKGFFEKRGWCLKDEQFYTELSETLGRPTPLPFVFKLLAVLLGRTWARPFKRMSGFILWERRE